MFFLRCFLLFAFLGGVAWGQETSGRRDRVSRLLDAVGRGEISVEAPDELGFLRKLLAALEVPVSSQMLVMTATSLQKQMISPRRPRALYFNEDTYVGYVPGGRVEILSLEEDEGLHLGIFDRAVTGRMPTLRHNENCLTCHQPPELGGAVGLVIESVVPTIHGGGMRAYRREQTGHGIPLGERFGGWLLTDAPDFPHQGNRIVDLSGESPRDRILKPGELYPWSQYPVATSELLPQLLQEHQAGAINRCAVAAQRLAATRERARVLAEEARTLARYFLFADEAPLPPGVQASAEYGAAFAANRRAVGGAALKDLDLQTRLLKYRCSYMIYTPAFTGLPEDLRVATLGEIARALRTSAPEYAYLPATEKGTLRAILTATVPGFPKGEGK